MKPRPSLAPLAVPLFGALACLGVATLPSTARTCSPPPSYSVEVLVDGRPLSAIAAKGTTYVEASKGREYAVRLTNRTNGRVAVALSVDGLNVIDAKRTSAREARKWILDPWQSIVLDGWQVSSSSARRFLFTTEEKSYGAWLGRTSDLGVISAAFFRERRPAPLPTPLSELRFDAGAEKRGDAADAPSASEPEGMAKSRARDELAATGIGREVDHRVYEVAFDEDGAPPAVVTLRYEFREALVRLGVLPAGPDDGALARRERARGFVDSGFAPDPYRN